MGTAPRDATLSAYKTLLGHWRAAPLRYRFRRGIRYLRRGLRSVKY